MKRQLTAGGKVHKLFALGLAILVAAGLLVITLAPSACAWTQMTMPDEIGYPEAVSAVDPQHVWVGGTQTWMWNGSGWQRANIVQSTSLKAIDATHVWSGGDEGYIHFFNGSSWATSAHYGGGPINAISACDINHVWAVQGDGPATGGSIYFFNGATWTTQYASATGPGLMGVYACDPTHVWAVGYSGKVMFFNGTTWTSQAGATTEDLHSVSGADASHVWAVGGTGLPGNGTVIFYNGSAWNLQANLSIDGNKLTLWAVAALDSNRAYAASDLGVIGYYNGGYWEAQETGTGDHLADVCTAQGKYVWVVGGRGRSLMFFDNPGEYTYYFAEGTTREGFDEWLCLQNPNLFTNKVTATYMKFGGNPTTKTYNLPPTSRTSINVEQEIGPGQDVSVKLSGSSVFFAERPMYFSYKQGVPGYGWTGGSCAKGAHTPAKKWYFAEGTTREGFEEWLCIQNPNPSDTQVTVDYIFAGAYTQQKKYMVGKQSRLSVFVNGDVGPGQDVSVRITSDLPVVAERPMYFNYKGIWTGGHDVTGVDYPRTKWYFAEGTTREGFDEYLAVSNMNGVDADLTIHFIKTDGTETIGNEKVPANSRWTLKVNDKLGPNVDSCIVVESSQPVVVERPMYFSYGPGWTGGHDVTGANYLTGRNFFAEGCTLDGFDEYLCLGNPGTTAANATIRFMREDGQVVEHKTTIGAKTRVTLKVADIVGRGHSVSAEVLSDQSIVAERPMYFSYGPAGWTGGHDVLGQ